MAACGSSAMTPDVYRHRSPTLGQKRFSLIKDNNRIQDQERDYHPNDDYTFVPVHLFTPGTRQEAACHTLGKMLLSVT